MKKTCIKVLDSTRAALLEQLRGGATLTAESIGALGEELNALYEKLAAAWGGKRYFTPASVVLFDDAHLRPDDYVTTYLCFGKHERTWAFSVETEHCRDCDGDSRTAILLSSASLDIRVRAIEKLPELEAALARADEQRRSDLLRAVDKLSNLVETAQNGTEKGGARGE